MAKEMLINVSEGEECRIALLDNGRVDELYMERTSATSHVGNIYKGKVTNVEPSIQAAFVDFGLGRNGFLHISDLMPSYFGQRGDDVRESVGRKMARRDRPPIQRCLRRGDEIVVQIIKEGIGTKGPTLNTYLSIPGRILVMMPGMGKMGVSRKIEDDAERRRLRQILDSLKPPKDVGFIIRTAGIGKSKAEIQRDLNYLTRLWLNLVKRRDTSPAPVELYTEGDLVARTVRDVFTSDVDRVIVDNKDVAKRVKEVIKLANPRTKNKVELYEEPIPLFHKAGIEGEIEQMHSRHVPLPSGGGLVIDSTEAVVAIDVNSGKSRIHSDAETTAFKTDLEAADEIPRQLRLRDLGGVIICDFIDLRFERHRRELEKRLHDNLQNDRAKTKVLRMSQFGIIEMTRQRMRPSLKRSIYFDCPHCKGAGLVKTPESMSLDAMRRLAIAVNDKRVQRVELSVCPDVSYYLQNRKRGQIATLEEQAQKRILIQSDVNVGLDEMRLNLYDSRDGLVYLESLGMVAQPGQLPVFGRRDGRRSRFEDQRSQASRQPPRGPSRSGPPGRDVDLDEPDEFENAEAEAERREEDDMPDSEMEMDRSDSPPPVSVPGDLDTEAADEAGVDAEIRGESENGAALPAGDDQTGRRRRRRRGRRGRGRGRAGGPPLAAGAPGAAADEAIDRDESGDDSEANFSEGRDELDRDTAREPNRLPPRREGSGRRDRSDELGPAPDEISPSYDDYDLGDDTPAAREPRPAARPRGGNRGPARRDERSRPPAPAPIKVDDRKREQSDEGPHVDSPPTEEAGSDTGDAEGAPRRRRRRRGGRGRRRGGANSNIAGEPALASAPAIESRPAAGPVAPPVADEPRAPESKEVIRTGSADRHLAADEVVNIRPRSFRDLDAIPDDLD
jgi:ribonuclease E